jgi:shikimate kinase
MNLVLIGFRGTGKTSVGQLLAERLGLEFIDADDFLEKKTGKSIQRIFEEGGEDLFRQIESEVIAEIAQDDEVVIAAGGGAILREENVARLKQRGVLILLEADADTIHKRLTADTAKASQRPNLTDKDRYEEIRSLLESRKPYYDRVADVRLNTAKLTVAQVVDTIASYMGTHN